ncbi:MAG: ankyrin repeat domain-containing protein [Gammaproteobacteria bacterium]|nr:ankyrin repeat domain-containing protein [Gammaproteobacteria bacterium]
MEEGNEESKQAGVEDNGKPISKRLSRASGRRTLGRSTFKNSDPYFLAVEAGDLEKVKQYVPSKDSPNKQNQLGKTGLHIAAGLGHVNIMEYLIEHGADVNFDGKSQEMDKQGFDDRGSFRRLPIHDAAENGQKAAIECLVRSDAKVDEKDATGVTPLHLATKEGHFEVVKILCDNGANLDTTNVRDDSEEIGDTAVLIALMYDHREIAIEFVRRGANFGCRNKEGKSAYLMAFQKDLQEVLQAMDEKLAQEESDESKKCTSTRFQRAGLDYIDEDENTLFHHAAISGDVKAITMLHGMGGDPKKTNKKGRNPLFLAAKHGQKEAMIKLHLLGVNHTETDRFEISPLEIAEKYEHAECVQLLQEWPEPQVTVEKPEEDSNSASEDEDVQSGRTAETHSGDEEKKQENVTAEEEDVFLRMMSAINKGQPKDDTTANKLSITSDEQPHQSSPVTANSEEHAQVLKECHSIFDLLDKHEDPELTEFLQLLSHTTTIDEISDVKTKSGKNFLCMIAKHDPTGKLISLLKLFSVAQIEKLTQLKTTNGENCLHIACQFLHLVLFEFCIAKIPLNKLVEMARAKTVDSKSTPYHYLCASTSNDTIRKRKSDAESKNFLSPMVSREVIANSKLPENLCLMLRRMGTVFGEYPDIFTSADLFGNTGLMLCAYTLHTTLITTCLESIIDQETKLFCILQSNQSKIINPLRYTTSMGDAVVLEKMMKPFGNRSQTVCSEQQLLQWSHVTTVPYQLDSPLRPQLVAMLEFLITHYYWDHEKAGFTEEFKDLLINEFHGKTLLLRSLDDCGGVLINRLLKVKHLSRKPEVLFLLMGHMTPMPAPHSPRGFVAQSAGLDSHKSGSSIANASSPAFDLRRELLHRVFRVDWSDKLLHELSLHIVSTLGTPRYTSLNRSSDEKILRIINSNLCDSRHQNLSVDYSVLILALFYQVTQVSEQKQAIEAQYVNKFKEHTKIMLDKMSGFYDFLAEKNQALADQFLGELFEGNSLLKAALTELFPDQAECLKLEKTNFVAYTKKLWFDNKACSDDSLCVLQ